MSLEGQNIFQTVKSKNFTLAQEVVFRTVALIQPADQQCFPLRNHLSEQISLQLTPLTVVLQKETDVARCLFWVKPTEEQEALSPPVVPTWLLLVNESLSLIKPVSAFRGFDLSELYTELLCNSPYISVFTICSPFSNVDMCYCLSTMCHQFTTTNSVKWKSGQGEIYFRHFCSTSFYSLPHANHMNSERGSKK